MTQLHVVRVFLGPDGGGGYPRSTSAGAAGSWRFGTIIRE